MDKWVCIYITVLATRRRTHTCMQGLNNYTCHLYFQRIIDLNLSSMKNLSNYEFINEFETNTKCMKSLERFRYCKGGVVCEVCAFNPR